MSTGLAIGLGAGVVVLILVVIGAVVMVGVAKRQRRIQQMKRFRRDAQAHTGEFSDVDKATLT